MPTPERASKPDPSSARALTLAAYASFVPIGLVTVLLGPLLPTLSARWSLDYSQSGALFSAQFLSSTVAVSVSGWLAARKGYRFAINTGLVVTGISMALLLAGSRVLGIICIAGYGAGFGLTVPPSNLLVSEVNPERRSAALNTLNFCWSVGAVACPFLVAAAADRHRIPVFLWLVAALSFAVVIGIAAMPSRIVEPEMAGEDAGAKTQRFDWRRGSVFVVAALFFIYVGTETGFGGWVASYARSVSISMATAMMLPSFFYGSMTVGRWAAPMVLRRMDEIKLAQAGALLASAGMAALLLSHSTLAVAASACVTGLGLSSVYPITISMLTREFGTGASRAASVMFTMANLGGSCLPWLVGVSSGWFGSLRAGMAVPLIGSIAIMLLYFWKWTPERQQTL